jgi:hypothetical protein
MCYVAFNQITPITLDSKYQFGRTAEQKSYVLLPEENHLVKPFYPYQVGKWTVIHESLIVLLFNKRFITGRKRS